MRPDQRLTAEHPRGVALVHDKVHAQVIIPVFCQEKKPIESGLVEQSIRTICMLTKNTLSTTLTVTAFPCNNMT